MALNVVLEPQYLFVRLVLWAIVFAAAIFDATKARHIKVAGYQLQRGIILVLGAQLVQDSLLLANTLLSHSHAGSIISYVHIFFEDLSDSLFIVRPRWVSAGKLKGSASG